MSGMLMGLAVCACGGVGAALRYVCDTLIKANWSKAFPLSTLVINVLAGFLAGVVVSFHSAGIIGETWRLALVVGLLGGFSTFSTAINEMISLVAKGRYATFSWYVIASIMAPVAAVVGGMLL